MTDALYHFHPLQASLLPGRGGGGAALPIRRAVKTASRWDKGAKTVYASLPGFFHNLKFRVTKITDQCTAPLTASSSLVFSRGFILSTIVLLLAVLRIECWGQPVGRTPLTAAPGRNSTQSQQPGTSQ